MMIDRDRKNCPMRHKNGNCLPMGGFCTAVNDEICAGLRNAYNHGEPVRCRDCQYYKNNAEQNHDAPELPKEQKTIPEELDLKMRHALKVIKGLEIYSAGKWDSTSGRDHTNCPYYPAGYTGCTCKLLMRDALALLKEQEAVDKNTGEWKNGHCSCCGEDVASMLDTWTNVQNFPFCPICGAKQKR